MKIPHWLLGLVMIGAVLGGVTIPAQAESKVAQCRRFDQAMMRFGDSLVATNQSERKDPVVHADRLLAVFKTQLKQLEGQKFADAKIRAFQRQAISLNIAAHNDLTHMTNAYEKGDRATFDTYRTRYQQAPPRVGELERQFLKYCGRR
jgi:hypothetical protein